VRVLLLLSSSSVTGPAELCLDDARALRRAGHEVLFGCDTRRPGNYADAIRGAGFPLCEELALCPKPRPLEVLRDAVCLRKRLAEVDLVHCRFSHDHAVTLAALSGMSRRPAVVRTVEMAKAMRPGAMRGVALRSADALVVSCEAYAHRLVADHDVPREKVHVVHGRVDCERFCPGDRSSLRRELGVGEGEVLFGIVSRIKEDRHHESLIRAFARLPAGSGARLVVVGRGEHEPALRALVSSLGLSKTVLFAGYRTGDALVAAYRALDVMCWLAEGNDGTCRAVLEAMACGTPVLCGRAGAMGDIVRDEKDGLLAEVNDGALEGALRRLGNHAQRNAMARSARERALAFSAENRAEELGRAYEAALVQVQQSS
jgi:glycosyltransferase involved in cell wall biosynthesis